MTPAREGLRGASCARAKASQEHPLFPGGDRARGSGQADWRRGGPLWTRSFHASRTFNNTLLFAGVVFLLPFYRNGKLLCVSQSWSSKTQTRHSFVFKFGGDAVQTSGKFALGQPGSKIKNKEVDQRIKIRK